MLTIIKIEADGTEKNYGGGFSNPYDVIPKSYKFNGMFYESKKSKSIYIVEEQ